MALAQGNRRGTRFRWKHGNTSGGAAMNATISPNRVRYIKLGRGGGWEAECLSNGIIRFGFDAASAERFPLCRAGNWSDLTTSFLEAGKDKGTATRFTNEARLFFEDDGATLWITFMFEHLYWGFLTPEPAWPHPDGDGVVRTVQSGWRSKDINGGQLSKERLSGALTKLAAYRGTSCDVDVHEYVIRRINGEKTLQAERATDVKQQMIEAVVGMMTLLTWHDFETLVDLVFSVSGWRRQGVVGKTQKTIDLDLTLPTTGERAFVQVKSSTDQATLDEYVSQFETLAYDRMFYIYHSATRSIVEPDDASVTVVGPERLAEMIVDAGLVSWLIRKVT